MRNPLTAALFAALWFCTACNDRPAAPPPKVEVKSQPMLKPSALRSAPSPAPPAVTAPVPPADPLALEHEDGRPVDHLARSVVLREQGDLEGALAEARRAVFDAPSDPDAISELERIARLLGNRPLRMSALERIWSLHPMDATPLIQKARVQLGLKDYQGAIRTGHRALEVDPMGPEAFQAIGRAHLSLGQLAPAISMFEKVVQLDPNHGFALNNLGFTYLRANRDREAAEVLTRAAGLLPQVAYVHNNLGVALERLVRTDEARRAYVEASLLSPRYVKARVNVARVSALPADEAETMSDLPADSWYPED